MDHHHELFALAMDEARMPGADYKKHKKLLLQARDAGSGDACFYLDDYKRGVELGHAACMARHAYEEDDEALAQKVLQLGDTWGLAVLYYEGGAPGVNEDRQRARPLILELAEQGNRWAQARLGTAISGLLEDPEERLVWL